jgi:hypothetical protein
VTIVCDTVFATLAVDAAGRAAVLYWTKSLYHGVPLVLVDWDLKPLEPSLWSEIDARMTDLALERRAREGVFGLFVEDMRLAALAESVGCPATTVPEHISVDTAWKSVCQSVTYWRRSGWVGMTGLAAEKMRDMAFGANSYAYGPRADVVDATVPAYAFGVVVALDEALARKPHVRPAKVKMVA